MIGPIMTVQMERPPAFRIECSWCGKVMEEGDPGAPTSHGICSPCKDKLLQDYVDEKAGLVKDQR